MCSRRFELNATGRPPPERRYSMDQPIPVANQRFVNVRPVVHDPVTGKRLVVVRRNEAEGLNFDCVDVFVA